MSWLGIKPEPLVVLGKHCRKEPFEQLVNSYTEHLHMSARTVENARDKVDTLLHCFYNGVQCMLKTVPFCAAYSPLCMTRLLQRSFL
jgi:hypothetical protein